MHDFGAVNESPIPTAVEFEAASEAANVLHDSRVHLIAPLPSLIHCSHVPRLL
jgi:hypothetical protein